MRHVLKPGDTTRGGCESCKAMVFGTYNYGQIKLTDGTVVENVMRALCDDCGEIIAVAHQSAPAIKAARAQRDLTKARSRTTVRVPRPLADFAASQLLDRGANPDRLDLMLKTFVSMALDGPTRRTDLVNAICSASDPVLELRPEVTLHLDLSNSLRALLKELQAQSGLRNLSDFVRRMLVVMDADAQTDESMRKVVLLGF